MVQILTVTGKFVLDVVYTQKFNFIEPSKFPCIVNVERVSPLHHLASRRVLCVCRCARTQNLRCTYQNVGNRIDFAFFVDWENIEVVVTGVVPVTLPGRYCLTGLPHIFFVLAVERYGNFHFSSVYTVSF